MKIIWVSTTGDDTTGDGSKDHPYKTLDMGISVFVSGDQIRLLPGTFITTDSVIMSGVAGSIFAESPQTVYIQPQKTTKHQACVAIIDSPRFSMFGLNVLQAADNSGNFIGIYAENIENFLCYTCTVSDFDTPSGLTHGIFASGTGRVEDCKVSNMKSIDGILYGIRTMGIDQIDCEVTMLSGGGNCQVIGQDGDGLLI